MSVVFRNLLAHTTDARVSAREAAESLRFGSSVAPAREDRPHVLLNMASTVDGSATIAGRSGAIGGAADRELFHELRAVADAVLVGAGTLRTERYNRIVDDEPHRQRRRERGMAEEPFACVVSSRLDLDPAIRLLSDPTARVVILTSSPSSLAAGPAAQIEYVRTPGKDGLDLAAALGELRHRFDIRVLLCEGGPHLNAQLLAAGLVDELMLTLAPKLAGASSDELTLAITAGQALEPPIGLELLALLESQSYLFLRYRVHGS
jgi:riboflavin-specific deaminase-like protein